MTSLTVVDRTAAANRDAQDAMVTDAMAALDPAVVSVVQNFLRDARQWFQQCEGECWSPERIRRAELWPVIQARVSKLRDEVTAQFVGQTIAARRRAYVQALGAARVALGEMGQAVNGALIEAFDPSQVRDEDGKWTDGGGGDSGTTTDTATSTKVPGVPSPSAEKKDAAGDERQRRGHIIFNQKRDALAVKDLTDAGLSTKEARTILNAVKTYTGNEYADVNRCLADPKCHPATVATKSGNVETVVRRMDTFLENAPAYEGKALYRAMALSPDIAKQALCVGCEISWPGYTSTSSTKGVAGAILKRLVKEPAGNRTKIMMRVSKYKSGVSVAHLSKWMRENEVLFPRKARFKVTKVTHKPTHVEVDVEEAA